MKSFSGKKEIIKPIKTPIPEPESKPDQKYKVVLATKNYVVFIGDSGTNEFRNGDYSHLQPGDMVAF